MIRCSLETQADIRSSIDKWMPAQTLMFDARADICPNIGCPLSIHARRYSISYPFEYQRALILDLTSVPKYRCLSGYQPQANDGSQRRTGAMLRTGTGTLLSSRVDHLLSSREILAVWSLTVWNLTPSQTRRPRKVWIGPPFFSSKVFAPCKKQEDWTD